MALHAISVFDKVEKLMKPWKKLHLKSTIKCFKEVKIDKWEVTGYILLISPHRLLC